MVLSLADAARQVLGNVYVLTLGGNTPPGAPALGDRHVVGTAPVGLWATHANAIAYWNGIAWTFVHPTSDVYGVFNATTQSYYSWNQVAWILVTSTNPSFGLFEWAPDATPAAPDAMDDEFIGASLDLTKWTVGNPGGNFAVVGAPGGVANSLDTVRQMLRVTSAAAAGPRYGWVSQPINAAHLADCTFVTRTHCSVLSANNTSAGLLLGETNMQSAPTLAKFFTTERFAVGGGLGAVARRYNNYTGLAATTQNYNGPTAAYLAQSIQTVAGVTTVIPYWSADGVGWYTLGAHTGVVLPFTVGFIALGADCNNVGNDGILRFAFFRAFPGTFARDTFTLGRRIALPIFP